MGKRKSDHVACCATGNGRESSPPSLCSSTSFTWNWKTLLREPVLMYADIARGWLRKCSFLALCSITKTACCMISRYGIQTEPEQKDISIQIFVLFRVKIKVNRERGKKEKRKKKRKRKKPEKKMYIFLMIIQIFANDYSKEGHRIANKRETWVNCTHNILQDKLCLQYRLNQFHAQFISVVMDDLL